MKDKIKLETLRRKKELSTVEFVVLWLIRASLVFAIFYAKAHEKPYFIVLAIIGNLAATFVTSVFSLIFPKKLLIGRLPYKTQLYISYFAFLGSTVNQSLGLGWDNYDKWLHFFSGYLVVFMGYHLFKAISPEKESDEKQSVFAGFGFSCTVAMAWELFEFMADYFIPGSVNQGYTMSPDYNMLFFKIFGMGAGNIEQAPLYDTMFDIMTAVVGAVSAIIVLRIMKKFIKKKENTTERIRPEEEETAEV